MLDIPRALSDNRLLRACTGMNRRAFEKLCHDFEAAYEADLAADTRPRQRARGGGRKARLRNIEDKLFFILFYFKCYPTFDLLGLFFDLERGRSNRWVHRLQKILEKALGRAMVLPERKIRSLQEFCERFPTLKTVIVDGTERPIQRPKDNEKQKSHYSGKKKRHTRKHTVLTTPEKQIIVLSPAREGKVHDKRQLSEENLVEHIPDEVSLLGDLGYQGLQNEYVNIHLPHKKPKGKKLSAEKKAENRELSRERVVCEHAIGGMKRYRAVAEIYRNHVPNFDDCLMLTSAGLWNYYLEAA